MLCPPKAKVQTVIIVAFQVIARCTLFLIFEKTFDSLYSFCFH